MDKDEAYWADYEGRLRNKLKPSTIRSTLGFAAIYQLTHEMIKTSVLDRVHDFFCDGFDENGMTYDEASYRRHVLNLAPGKGKRMRASLLWLVGLEAITIQQADRLDDIYAHRHSLTHELGRYLVDPDAEPDQQLLTDALAILRDIQRFWTGVEFSIGTFEDHPDVEPEQVTPMMIAMLQTCLAAYFEGVNLDAARDAQGEPSVAKK